MKLVKISKQEALKLNKDYGVPFGENGISHSWAKYQHYYLCEGRKNIACLEKIRRKQLVETFE
jgi:hypothetical protein